MQLSWSHAVLNVRDLDAMVDFYTNVLGFRVSDRGDLAENAPEIVFLSNDPNEHHLIGMIPIRDGETAGSPLNHLAFRVAEFADVKALFEQLAPMDAIKTLPLSHGNTFSLYFNDPEGNGLEVFWDTPWHVAQPQGKVWDTSLDEQAALSWVEENFSSDPSFAKPDLSSAEFANRHKP